MSEPRHTPLPWSCESDKDTIYSLKAGASVAQPFGESTEERAANAALIVRAVNCHQELVAACLAALARPGRLEGWQEEQVRAALAKARPDPKEGL